MDIWLDAKVVANDGSAIGKVDKVVFDPERGETKSIVVRQGAFLGRDVEIPVEDIQSASRERIELRLDQQGVEGLLDFIEVHYLLPPSTWVSPYGWGGAGVLWPGTATGYAGYMGAEVPQASEPHPDEESQRAFREDYFNAVIDEGSEVMTADGEKLGEVANLVIDSVSHRVDRLIVRYGLLISHEIELPGEWIEAYDDHSVTLNVNRERVEQLSKDQ